MNRTQLLSTTSDLVTLPVVDEPPMEGGIRYGKYRVLCRPFSKGGDRAQVWRDGAWRDMPL